MTKVFFKIQTMRLAAILSLHYLNISIEVCINQGNHCDYSRFSTDEFISDLSQIKRMLVLQVSIHPLSEKSDVVILLGDNNRKS